ncbi:MAG: FAD-binding protein [Planctomycetaceae bacterium]|nr:FAD-binding protein [Planctomycetaceae bacterium]
MRWNHSCAVQKFIRSALAFSCLSVIPLAGCSNSSSRNFSLGLREEAAKSALIAEEQLAEQKARAAEAKADASDEAELAAKESRRSPLLSFLRGEPKSSGDPFLEAEAVASTEKKPEETAKPTQPKDTAAWNAEGVLQVNGTREQKPTEESSWDQVMKDYLAEGDKTERPAWEQALSGDADAKIPSLTEQYLKKGAAEKEADTSEFAWAQEGSGGQNSRVVGPEPPADWAKTATAGAGTSPATESASSPWATESTVVAGAQSSGESREAHRVPVARVVNEAQATKLRIQSLLSQAHSDLLRGDAYSAYRSALLAQQETEKNNVPFSPGEERPQELVNQISQRLWGNQPAAPIATVSNQAFAAATSQTTSRQKTAQSSVGTESQYAVFNDVKQSEWVAVPEGPTGMPKVQPQPSAGQEPAFPALPAPAASRSAVSEDANSLPDIRANERRKIQRLSASVEETPGRAQLAYVEEGKTVESASVQADSWGSFQQDARQQIAAPVQPRSLSAPSWTEWSAVAQESGTSDVSSSQPTQDGWKSALAQAPAPPMESALPAPAAFHSAPTVAPAPHRDEQVTARTGKSNSKWAIIGFVAALAATVLGLRARRETA